jgi:hypothetical protein
LEKFPDHQPLQEYSLMILSNVFNLEEIPFDKFKGMKLLMNSLVKFEGKDMNQFLRKENFVSK